MGMSFTLKMTQKNDQRMGLIDDGARGIVEMLFCTSLLALVGAADQPQSSPRKLQIVNTKVRQTLVSPSYVIPNTNLGL